MTDEIKRLKELVDGSSRIVFFGGAGVSTESGSLTFAAPMDSIISSGTFPPKRF